VASACTSVAFGAKAESVREKERTRLTRAAFSMLALSALPRSRRNTCVSAATITCGRGRAVGGGPVGGGQLVECVLGRAAHVDERAAIEIDAVDVQHAVTNPAVGVERLCAKVLRLGAKD
jgi:hypothetical protein